MRNAVFKFGICDYRAFVLTVFRLPFFERHSEEIGRAVRFPVKVACEFSVQARDYVFAVAEKLCGRAVDNYVALVNKLVGVFFAEPRQRDLRRRAVREYVVAHRVVFAVMLVVALLRRVVDVVFFDNEIRAALVVVDAPASVAVRVDAAYFVARNRRIFVRAERIDSTHVAKQTASDFENAIVGNFVVSGVCGRKAPCPAARNARIVPVENRIVGKPHVACVHVDYADPRFVVASVGVYYVVGNLHVLRVRKLPPRIDAYFYAARAVVEKFVLRNPDVLRAVPDFKPIGVCVAHGVVFEFQVFNAVEIQRTAERNRRLRVLTPVCGRIVRGVLESDSANRKPRKRIFRRFPASRHKARRHGIVRRNVFGRFAVARVVPECFAEGVEIESAPFVERGENVSDAQPRIFVPLGKRNRQGVADFQRSRLSVGIARYVEKPAVGVYPDRVKFDEHFGIFFAREFEQFADVFNAHGDCRVPRRVDVPQLRFGAACAFAVYEKRLDFVGINPRLQKFSVALPARNFYAAAYDGFAAAVERKPGMFFRKHKRLLHKIPPRKLDALFAAPRRRIYYLLQALRTEKLRHT